MEKTLIPFYQSLKFRLCLITILPALFIVAAVIGYVAVQSYAFVHQRETVSLKILANEIAAEIERGNARAVLAAQIMAYTQEEGLFGDREKSNAFAYRILKEFPEFTASYFVYEPNADGKDAEYSEIHKQSLSISDGIDQYGRFLPYWFRDHQDDSTLTLEPSVDMETSLYYEGVRELFEESKTALPMVTEPYVYEGKLLVEQTFPILKDRKFVGVGGVDRSLEHMEDFLIEISQTNDIDLFLISSRGKFIATSSNEGKLKTQSIAETEYSSLFNPFYESRKSQLLQVKADPTDQQSYYYVSSYIPTGDWMVILRKSEANVLGPIWEELTLVTFVAFAGILLMVVLVWLFASSVATRINYALGAAQSLAAGDLRQGFQSHKQHKDEIGVMFHAFEQVVESYTQIDSVCSAIAKGDFSKKLIKRSDRDTFAESINKMASTRMHAEQALKENEELFRSMVANVPGVIYRCINDELWTMKYISSGIEELSGFPAVDFLSNNIRSYASIIHKDDLNSARGEIHKALSTNSAFHIEYRMIHRDGTIRWVSENGQLDKSFDGEEQIINGCIINITKRKAFEEELKKLSTALEQNPVSVVITDTHGAIEYVNPKFCEVTGYANHEVIGQNPRILKSDETINEIYKELWQTISSGNEWSGEFHNRKKNGELYWESATISPIFSNEGHITHYLAVKEDITERKKMEENLRRINFQSDHALELTKAGYWHLPIDGSGWYNSSERAAAIFGDPPRPPHYRYRVMEEWFDNVKAGDEEAAQKTLKNFQDAVEGKIPLYDATYAYKRPIDGNVVWIHASGHVIKDENGIPTDMYGVTQDITDRVLVEQDLQKRLKELNDFQKAMLNIMDDLDVEKQKANDATKAKSDFLASMSHEIRTPLNGMIANLELLELSDVTEEQQNTIGSAKFCADTLLAIIGDILDFSKIEAGKMELNIHEMSLHSTLKNIHSMMLPRAVQKDINLHMFIAPNVPEKVMADSIRVRQIIVNLVGNAIKFTDHGGVLIRISRFEDETSVTWIRFDIIDSGIGFAPDKASLIFEAFLQEEQTTTRKFGGTGLGLAISKRIVEMKQGQIGCTGSPGYGAYFYCQISLPVVEESEPIKTDWLQDYNVVIIQDVGTEITELTNRLQQYKVKMHVLHLEDLKEESLCIASPFDNDRDCIIAVTDRPEHIVWQPLINENRPKRWLLISQSKSPNREYIALRQGFSYYQFEETDWTHVYQFILSVGTQSTGIPLKETLAKNLSDVIDQIRRKNIQKPLLVIDDFEMNRNVAIKQLKTFGLSCETAVNGKDGLDKARENDYALIFVDWMMPVMDGIEFSNQYRRWEKEQGKRVPVIAMTANALKGDEERCRKAGMDDYLSKPVKMERLAEILVKWLSPNSALVNNAEMRKIELDANVVQQVETNIKPPIDMQYLSEILAEDDSVELAKILNIFKDELDYLIVEIEKSINDRDRQAVRDLSHNAKGGAGYAAARALSDIYEDIHHSAFEASWEELQMKFIDAQKEWIKVKQFIESINENMEA